MRKSCWIMGLALWGALAFGATDFSGTWILDSAKSDPLQMGRGGRGGGGQASDIQITLTITQAENEWKVNRTMVMGGNERSSDLKYTLDGKENTNPAAAGRGEFKAKANWKGETLVIEGVQVMSTQRGDFEVPTREVYSLSADGKVLTIETTRSGRQGERTSKQVYNRK